MNSIFFRPWVGSAYTTGGIFGKRLVKLILPAVMENNV